jgi:hypothetical protein
MNGIMTVELNGSSVAGLQGCQKKMAGAWGVEGTTCANAADLITAHAVKGRDRFIASDKGSKSGRAFVGQFVTRAAQQARVVEVSVCFWQDPDPCDAHFTNERHGGDLRLASVYVFG